MRLKKYGMTLLELMVVIVVIAVITTAGIVSFSSLNARRLDAESRKVANALCEARDFAVAQRLTYIVDFDSANKRFMIYKTSVNPANEIDRQYLNVDTVSVTNHTTGSPVSPERVSFFPPLGTGQRRDVLLTVQSRAKTVEVFDQTGYVKRQ